MSLYSSVSFASLALPGGGAAVVTGSTMSIRIEEEEMDLILRFQGNLLGANGDVATLAFEVNGVAATALPSWGTTFLTADLQAHANIELRVTGLAQGEHKVALLGNDVGSGTVTLDGANFVCTFSAERVSSAASLAHGVDSKVQGIY